MLFLPQDEMKFLDGCGGARLLVHMNADNSLALCPYTYDRVIGRPAAGQIMQTLTRFQARVGIDQGCAGLQANVTHHPSGVPIWLVG